MKFEYDLDMGDYRNYLEHYYQNSTDFKKTYRNRLGMGIVSLLVLNWFLYQSVPETIVIVIGLVSLLIYILSLKKLFLYFTIEKDLKKVQSQMFTGHYVAEILDEKIKIQNYEHVHNKDEIEWEKISTIGENDWYYFLYHEKRVSILPITRMPEDAQQFIERQLRTKSQN
ncbi:hypothetical protein CHH58_07995 [Terribacillus saccharophilus]|uniref:hypothetical protein n=3 Tax=Terribacillus saccharophilus TaxID=361277 RepID=UPI000BA5F5E0|nr:hypothetical protein [Terribacillus saccharophilus]PAF23102.1 hypothetical protein CHH49_00640 [Terribacillus saccharophilus]PAF36790.1 hypothetical protein CHH58_07995 [Terribacillus saccharophilus]